MQLFARLNATAGVLLASGLLADAGVFVSQAIAEEKPPIRTMPADTDPERSVTQPVGTDLLGDPLPRFALARIGSARLRHGANVNDLAFSPDGALLASTGDDGRVQVWDTATGKLRYHILGRSFFVAFSRDGKLLATAPSHEILISQAASGKEVGRLKGHTNAVSSADFSPDGKALVSGSYDRTVRLWDCSSLRETFKLEGHSDVIMSVAFAKDGKTVASGGYDHSVRIWNVESRKVERILQESGLVYSVDYSPDSARLLVAGNFSIVRLWNASTGEPVAGFQGPRGIRAWFSPSGRWLGSSELRQDHNGYNVKVCEAQTGRECLNLHAEHGYVGGVTFAPDGRLFAMGDGKFIRLRDVATGEEKLKPQPCHGPAAFSPDGKIVASYSGSRSATSIGLYAADSGRELRSLPLQGVDANPDEIRAVKAWFPNPAECRDRHIRAGNNGRTLSVYRTTEHSNSGAARNLLEIDVRAWDPRKPDPPQERPIGSGCRGRSVAYPVAFSSDGKLLASVSDGEHDPLIRLWEVDSGRLVRQWDGVERITRGLAFVPGRRTLAVAGGSGAIRLWNLPDGAPAGVLEGHAGPVLSLAFAADGKRLVTSGADTTVLVWDMEKALSAPPRPTREWTDRELEEPWTRLKAEEAGVAYASVAALISAGEAAVKYLRARLTPVPPAALEERLRGLLDRLDADDFSDREQAQKELESIEKDVEGALPDALKAAKSEEARTRLEKIIQQGPFTVTDGEQLRRLRAIQVLESIGTEGAREILKTLASGFRGSRATLDAQAALARLTAR